MDSSPPPGPSPQLRDFDERLRRIALRIGLAGLAVVAASFLMTAAAGILRFSSYVEAGSYAVILSGMTWAAWKNFHTKQVLHGGLVLLFLAYWVFTIGDFLRDDVYQDTLVFALFIPVFIAIGLTWQIQFTLGIVQAVLIYFCAIRYEDVFHPTASVAAESDTLPLTLAFFSGLLFILLGLVQMARQNTDDRLFKVIVDKQRLAATDPLTGLLNRRAFLEAAEETAKASGPVTLAFVDLNNFKPLNDQYGHAAGDAVLKAIAGRLQRCGAILYAARPGGDEFAAIVDPALSQDETDAAMIKLFNDLVCDVVWDGRLISVGASIGYARMAEAAGSLVVCLSEADAAMRRAKGLGGGVARFSQEIDGGTIESELLQIRFPQALAMGHIRPALQPIADAKTHEIVGYELLSRWTGTDEGRQPGPDEFIPVAEKLGLLNELLWSTLNEALKHWKEPVRALAINVSPGQLQKPEFIDGLLRVIRTHDVAPDAITLEITEQVALRNLDANVSVLERARRAGMSIALDDFGTGYSSLSILDRLPLDKLKIDQSLVHPTRPGESDSAILKGAIRLASELGLISCVEGVSSAAIADQMKRLGADQVQGFWIGRPTLVQPAKSVVRMAS